MYRPGDDALCRALGRGLRFVAAAAAAAWDDVDYNAVWRGATSPGRFHCYCEFAPHRREDASLGQLQYDVPISHLSPEAAAAALRGAAAG